LAWRPPKLSADLVALQARINELRVSTEPPESENQAVCWER